MTSHMNAQPPATPIQILLAEDNPGDVFLIREALREQGLEYELSVVEDGEVAILSSSDWPKDRLDTAALGANCYIQKPFSLEEFMEIGAVLKELLSSTTLVPTTE